MNITRRAALTVADNPVVSRFFRSSTLAKRVVDRFVAGETLDEALAATRRIVDSGLAITLDELGENVTTSHEAQSAVSSYIEVLRRMKGVGMTPNISVKLTMLGLDLGNDLAKSNTELILKTAMELDGFVRIDMEGSAYTEATMNLFEQLFAAYPKHVGIVIQSYLKRAERDVRRMVELGARVRLVKGAYAEPESVAFQSTKEIDSAYRKQTEMLLNGTGFPAIATHDPALVQHTIDFAAKHGIAKESFEFQMLYGVRRDEQLRLHREGYGMRVYVPFGTKWYPYFTRRIAERPANAFFVVRQLADRN